MPQKRNTPDPIVKAPTSPPWPFSEVGPRFHDPLSKSVWAAVVPVATHLEKLRRSYSMTDCEYSTFNKNIIIETDAILDGSRTEPNGCIYVWNVAKSLADICRRYQQGRDSLGGLVLGLLEWAIQAERQGRRA